ncbi:Histidine kinase-like ATPase domain-containing protein [Formivibrio citricus]|uniref:Histidine kinase-like ATPase domain-containing protein n=1 Tax=Formivibrio citricus TaxID=83765 RepID=A0A1I5CM35_9NEIS|nr:response regulator [Formivibrio citricus]SFN87936.1 Histidine kinase-like ATPase domain-containing protein [Formivibrio citricus]
METQREQTVSLPRVLVVDDEPFNLEILTEHLTDAGYQVVAARDGEEAWETLQHDGASFDAVLLDRMMPRMDGMEVLARIRQHPEFINLPVIMQTAIGAAENVREGLAAGAYYYLVKPYQRDMLVAIVGAAVGFRREKLRLESLVTEQAHACRMLINGDFRFRTLEEARRLTLLLSQASPNPKRVALGLSELLVNAVEHGNLEIDYSEKSRLLRQGRWQEEVERRLAEDCYSDRFVEVAFRREDGGVTITIIDQGEGFDWRPFLDFSPERAFDAHGRGISVARMLSFDSMEYHGSGNEVVVRVNNATDLT